MYFTDSHCHLNLNQFDNDLEAVILRSVEAGVRRIVVPGIDLETSHQAVSLAERFPQIFAAVGIHPNTPDAWHADTLRELKSLAQHPRVVAIGEIGMDNHWHDTDPVYQMQILQTQLDLAAEVQKPVILHSRDAMEKLLPVVLAWANDLQSDSSPLSDRAGVMHSFEGSITEAEIATKAGFFIGLAGPITFHNARNKHELATDLPLINILIETDAPYLSPHPFRGQRNEPANVVLVARKLADLKQMDLEQISEATTINSNQLFGAID